MKFFDLISKDNISINSTEKRIVEYILENYSSFSKMKITDMANSLYISSNTIIRLCKKLGYSGFSELKYDIISSNNLHEGINLNSDHISIHNSIIQTLSLNSSEAIHEAAELIHNSNRIVFFSLGLSQYSALSFCKRIQYFNKMCLVPKDRDENILFANNLGKGDLVFMISASGETDIIKKIIGIVKTKKVKIISITGLSQNFLSQLSDLALYAYLKEYHIKNHDLTSRLGFNIILDLIFEKFTKLQK